MITPCIPRGLLSEQVRRRSTVRDQHRAANGCTGVSSPRPLSHRPSRLGALVVVHEGSGGEDVADWGETNESGADPVGIGRESQLQLQLMGDFGLCVGGHPVKVPHGVQRLVAFLALYGPSHRTRVAGSLWPEVPDARAHARLRTAIWRVQGAGSRVVLTDGPVVRIDPSARVDSTDLATQAEGLLWREMVAPTARTPLVTAGELLPAWDEEWVVLERERLRQLRLQALEVSVRLLLQGGHIDSALDLALAAVRADSLRESARAALIRVYLAEGNVAEARRQFSIYRVLLRRELGIDPSPDLIRVLWGPERSRRRP